LETINPHVAFKLPLRERLVKGCLRLYKRGKLTRDDGEECKAEELKADRVAPFNWIDTREVTVTNCGNYGEDPVETEDVDIAPAVLHPDFMVTSVWVQQLVRDE